MAENAEQDQTLAAVALGGAVAGAFLGAIIGALTRIGPFVVLVGLCGAICGAAIGIMSELRARKRRSRLVEIAGQLQLAYAPDVSSEQIRYALELFPHWFKGSHWFGGKYRGAQLEVFDVVEQEEDTKLNDEGKLRTYKRITRKETVVLLPIEGIPEFRLIAQNWISRLMPSFGMPGITFEPAMESDVAAIERFQRHWRLMPGKAEADAGLSSSDREANVAAVRKLFSPRMMDCVRPWNRLSAQVYRDCLVVSRPGRLLPPENRRELLDDAVELRMNLLAESQRAGEHTRDPDAVTDRLAHITAK